MKPLWVVLIIVGIFIFMLGSCSVSTYNSMVGQQARVEQAVGNIDAVTQRRLDLIPNLVEVVKGYATHEKDALIAVIAARASATQVRLDSKDITPERLAKFQESQGQLSAALGRLMVVSERYPDLKADKHFSDLMAQLEGSENRINEARKRFNDEVKKFNVMISTFPNNIVNGVLFHGVKMDSFKADEAAKAAPKVNFGAAAKS